MVTVHRAFGFRFVIYTNDHGPPHVHVVRPGCEARVILEGPDGLTLDWVIGINHGDLRRIMSETQAKRGELLEAWEQIHG